MRGLCISNQLFLKLTSGVFSARYIACFFKRVPRVCVAVLKDVRALIKAYVC